MDANTATSPRHVANVPLRRAVLCIADESLRSQVTQALNVTGFEVLAEVDRGIETLPVVVEVAPDLVVLDVSLVGMVGMRLLGMIDMAAPDTPIVVLTPFDGIDAAVLESGAHAVVSTEDIRRLREVLSDLSDANTS